MSTEGSEIDSQVPSGAGVGEGGGSIAGGTRALEILREVFGYPEFLPGQAEVVQHLVQGSDAFVLMPTGGGKSLCYQVPALVREGVGVVISPLISLMKNQVDALRQAGVRAGSRASEVATGSAERPYTASLEGCESGGRGGYFPSC